MSRVISASSSPNKVSASALLSSVLPTPVGPRNMNEPTGRFGSFRPALDLRTARDTAPMASSCPMTLLWSSLSRLRSLSLSSCAIFVTGTPVHLATVSAMASAVTIASSAALLAFHSFFSASICLFISCSLSLSTAAFSNSWFLMQDSFSDLTFSSSSVSFLIPSGAMMVSSRTRADVSSIRSIALSGRNLSDIYLSDSLAAALMASSVILTL